MRLLLALLLALAAAAAAVRLPQVETVRATVVGGQPHPGFGRVAHRANTRVAHRPFRPQHPVVHFAFPGGRNHHAPWMNRAGRHGGFFNRMPFHGPMGPAMNPFFHIMGRIPARMQRMQQYARRFANHNKETFLGCGHEWKASEWEAADSSHSHSSMTPFQNPHLKHAPNARQLKHPFEMHFNGTIGAIPVTMGVPSEYASQTFVLSKAQKAQIQHRMTRGLHLVFQGDGHLYTLNVNTVGGVMYSYHFKTVAKRMHMEMVPWHEFEAYADGELDPTAAPLNYRQITGLNIMISSFGGKQVGPFSLSLRCIETFSQPMIPAQ